MVVQLDPAVQSVHAVYDPELVNEPVGHVCFMKFIDGQNSPDTQEVHVVTPRTEYLPAEQVELTAEVLQA